MFAAGSALTICTPDEQLERCSPRPRTSEATPPSPLRAGLQGRGRPAACVPYPIVTAAARPWPAVSSGNAGGSCGLLGGPFDSPWRRAKSRPREWR